MAEYYSNNYCKLNVSYKAKGTILENITDIILDYIRIENTDYAILIDGEWGCGKTQYFKNDLTPKLEEIENPNGDKFKVLYISLNGLSNINNISSEIIAANLGINEKGKLTKILYSSTDLIFNATSKFLKIDDYLENKDKIDFSKFIDYKNKILCFDDIERISSKLQLDEVLGYINTNFVEHNNVKVLIIGDISKIKDLEIFKDESEKLIGRKIDFSYNYTEIFSIILLKYEINEGFCSFLESKKILLTALFEHYSLTNLRTIFFYTNLLQRYFVEKQDIEAVVCKRIILFTLVITIEFKNGEFIDGKNEKRKDLWELTNNFIYLDILRDKLETDEKYIPSYSEKFVKKYLQNFKGLYQFYSSIFNHIVNGFLDVEKFMSEFTPSSDKIYIDALYKLNDYLILSDKELEENITTILDGLEKGIYNIYSHQSIFQKLFNLLNDGIIKLTVDDLKDKIYHSLGKAKLRSSEFDDELFDRGDFYVGDSDEAREVFSKIKELHKEYFNNNKKSSVLSIISKLEEEKATYSKIIHSFLWVNFSEFFSIEELIKKIKIASNYSTSKFFRFLAEKYRYDEYKTINDIPFIEKLISELKTMSMVDEYTPMKKAVLIDGLRILGNIYSEFERRKLK